MRCRRDNPALQSRMTCFPAFRPIESRASISPASVAGRRVPGGGHGRRRCLLRAVVPGRFDDEQHGDDDCQRPQHPRGPEQRTLTGRKRAPRRPVTTRGRAGSTGCRSPASRVGRDPGCRTRRNGRRGGPARGGVWLGRGGRRARAAPPSNLPPETPTYTLSPTDPASLQSPAGHACRGHLNSRTSPHFRAEMGAFATARLP